MTILNAVIELSSKQKVRIVGIPTIFIVYQRRFPCYVMRVYKRFSQRFSSIQVQVIGFAMYGFHFVLEISASV